MTTMWIGTARDVMTATVEMVEIVAEIAAATAVATVVRIVGPTSVVAGNKNIASVTITVMSTTAMSITVMSTRLSHLRNLDAKTVGATKFCDAAA